MEDVTFTRYDTADYLKTEADIAAYIEAVMGENGNDPACIARAMEVIARARKTIPIAP